MIQVEVKRNQQEIQEVIISGHAYTGDPGYDLVCSGTSAICFGMLNALDEILHEKDVEISVDENNDNKITIVNQHNVQVNFMLEIMLIQLKTLYEFYGDFISIQDQEV